MCYTIVKIRERKIITMYNYEYTTEKETTLMSENAWRFNDRGSADPKGSSWETIFDAYHDYRNSQQWQ
jgi:hypothetical protein